ncbi:MAG: methylated-DNA--[protein]-cysteine S-methyltransferase [Methylovirgula sp.]|jgi:methylated-DNA-[protein]-cysteine S-methyltransferase
METALHFRLETMKSPIGTLSIVTDDEARLRALQWGEDADALEEKLQRRYGSTCTLKRENDSPSKARQALAAYFDGDLHATESIAVASAGTEFQRDVWAALRVIPVGQTMSYGGLAAKIGRPKAMRAVGLANSANPIGIVVPCHRVIGADCSLTGFGGGLDRKRWLLSHEGAHYIG